MNVKNNTERVKELGSENIKTFEKNKIFIDVPLIDKVFHSFDRLKIVI